MQGKDTTVEAQLGDQDITLEADLQQEHILLPSNRQNRCIFDNINTTSASKETSSSENFVQKLDTASRWHNCAIGVRGAAGLFPCEGMTKTTSHNSNCSGEEIAKKNDDHYRYDNLFIITAFQKYSVCSFLMLENITCITYLQIFWIFKEVKIKLFMLQLQNGTS